MSTANLNDPANLTGAEEPKRLERGAEGFEKEFHECFNRAALGNAAQLPELLRETRAVGLSDDDVRRHLEESQVNFTDGGVDDYGYLVWRSCNNCLYITCETWEPKVTVASVKELFEEQDRSDSQASFKSKQ